MASHNFYCLLFNNYETLDLMGPVDFLHRIPGAQLHYISPHPAPVPSAQGFSVATVTVGDLLPGSTLLIPGGVGTRPLVNRADFLAKLTSWVHQSEHCLSVCTGSALLAATGLINGLPATSNKLAFNWVKSVNPRVRWVPSARWVQADKFYTASGVSAGMDMTLGFIADRFDPALAEDIAHRCEYLWNRDPDHDPFAV